MWRTNLKILALVVVVLGLYTLVANSIPQMKSEVPQALDLSGGVTPASLVLAGEQIYNGAGGCTACHGLGTRAPNLLADERGTGLIGGRCANREPGKDCKTYLWEALTEPGKYVVPGYQPIMPDMRRTLPADQVWAVVAFLESKGGTVDVTADDVRASQTAAPAAAAAPASTSTDPAELLNGNGCMGCHVLRGQGGTVGPRFDGIGGRLSKDMIRQAILDPNAQIASGFEAMRGVMPATFGAQLNGAQLESLVNYLAGLK